MKTAEHTINMLGEKMEVFVGAGCLSGCQPQTAARLPAIVSGLCKTLSRRQVARAFMHHVRIGDTVALVDRRGRCTFRLKMEAHSVCILGIHFNAEPIRNVNQVYYLANTRLWQRHDNRMAVARMTVGSEVVLREAVIIVDGAAVETLPAGTRGIIRRIGSDAVALSVGDSLYPDIPIHSVRLPE